MKYGICSGYFNPLHEGHLDYLEAAKKRCDKLIVIVNNDEQVRLKGLGYFMDAGHRWKIVRALRCVDYAAISLDKDKTVCESIRYIHKLAHDKENTLTFFNSGDRSTDESAEKELCDKLGIKTEYIDLPKVHSSRDFRNDLAK